MDVIRELGVLVLDHRCRRLSETLLRSAEQIYQARGLPFRARWTSTFLLLERTGQLPITEIAERIGLTHPAVIAMTSDMQEAGLVRELRDRNDGRRRLLALTPMARRLLPALRNIWDQLAAVQRERFAAAGCDIIAILDAVDDGLARYSLASEVLERVAKPRRSAAGPKAVARSLIAAVWLAMTSAARLPAQENPLPRATTRDVVVAVGRHLSAGYVYESKGLEMRDSLEARLRAGAFNGLTPKTLADSVTALLFRISRDRHLGLQYDPSPGEAPPEPHADPGPVPQPAEGTPESFGFFQVKVFPDGIGFVDLRGFSDAPEALAYADSMLSSLSGLRALIIDLRRNQGGGPGMVRLLSTYLFDGPTHLVSTFMRGMTEPRERWTLEMVRGPRLSRIPVYLLTSRVTISAAESFAFGLRINQRVTIVGEPTAGGGHFGEFLSLPAGFVMFLPRGRTFDPRTNQSWEATGLQPDVPVAAEDALARALRLIRQ